MRWSFQVKLNRGPFPDGPDRSTFSMSGRSAMPVYVVAVVVEPRQAFRGLSGGA